jgi:cytochrome c-type biogenesis protein CcmH
MCQGLSIADSGSSAARAQMDRVRELVAEGQTDEEIRAYFVTRYGEWALLEPSARGFNWLVWLGPPFLVLLGVFLISQLLRRRPAPPLAGPAPSEAAAGDRYLEAVREELKK